MRPHIPKGLPLPHVETATIVALPPGEGKGNWAGAPSVCKADGTYFLAYRMRRAIPHGRGYAVVIAASRDGETFETIATLDKDDFGAESLERPALLQRPDGGWRIYMSCATPGTKHWWVDAIDADHPANFDTSKRVMALPGDDAVAIKDPVVCTSDGSWLIWACCHDLTDPDATDRMVSRFGSSSDGLSWDLGGDTIANEPGSWFERGTRIADVLRMDGKWVAFYDGRASQAENGEELTGIAIGDGPGLMSPLGAVPISVSPWGSGSLRYLTVVEGSETEWRLYYEASLPDGSHALFSQPCAKNPRES
jgi:hypothetical protein